ncbi:hypothetical protein PHMEG_00029962 [Phytophthora megakarya]|uniref:Uncharacterized protein n=1 Tax=Phytophthora megakarya TaxID=4795 RepID=A0A225V171_9STRA|nr:hypothetical protein PHMEG_00029962 [Phytophthora megakarya]
MLMMVKVVAVLSKHLWGSAIDILPEKFTLERVADKSISHVKAAPAKPKYKVLSKRKATDGPVRDVHYNYGAMECHYCGGVYHRNIWSRASAKLRKTTHEPTPKMTSKGKAKAKKARREIPLEECQQTTDVAADACDTTLATPSSPAPSISHPRRDMEPAYAWGGQVVLDAQESDGPMDSVFAQHNIVVNGGHVKDAADQDCPLQPGEQQIAEALNLETMRLEDKGAASG